MVQTLHQKYDQERSCFGPKERKNVPFLRSSRDGEGIGMGIVTEIGPGIVPDLRSRLIQVHLLSLWNQPRKPSARMKDEASQKKKPKKLERVKIGA